ncbi:MAG: F0F1 ATP synthase subunit B [Acidobacteria bacterium]|nr:F0F1 ATP synthase subunit B [Acidobacteriota bacterium]
MRIPKFVRIAALSVALSGAMLPLAATPAFASGGEKHGDAVYEETVKCLEEAAANTKADKNTDTLTVDVNNCINAAPNPLIPDLSEVLWGGLAFLIVLVVLIKFAFPALKKGMKNREDKIRGDLEAAEKARQDSEAVKADYEAKLADARAEAGRIVEEARAAADAMRKDLVAKAETEAGEIKARAAEDVKAQSNRALADLQGQVAEISIDLAERIVGRSLDRDAQRDLVEAYINEVGRN